MFIIKNAWKSITRAKGRNILVGIIVITISAASCVSLAISNAAEDAKEQGLQSVSVTAQITQDMEKMRSQMESGSTTQSRMQMSGGVNLTADDYAKYKDYSEVKDYYYTSQISLNHDNNIEPYSDDDTSTSDTSSSAPTNQEGPGGGGKMMIKGMTADFALTGYSSESAMVDFYQTKTSSITSGQLFDFTNAQTDKKYQALINKTLATANNLKVGDQFTLVNSNKSGETYPFKVVGIYDTQTSEDAASPSGFSMPAAMKPENAIYISSKALESIVSTSAKDPADITDMRGNASTSELTSRVNATYVLGSKADYDKFVSDATATGLPDNYKVYSPDVDTYEKSLIPLENLAKFASTLLLIILLVGSIVLIVLTFFNIRERKYEVGVYTAIGIKKPKVASQFAVELLIVTLIAIFIGSGVGAVASVPVSNAMLASQVQSYKAEQEAQTQAMPGGRMDKAGEGSGAMRGGNRFNMMANNQNQSYIEQINTSINLTMLLELIGIGIVLAFISSLVSVSYVMRYEPLQILADR